MGRVRAGARPHSVPGRRGSSPAPGRTRSDLLRHRNRSSRLLLAQGHDPFTTTLHVPAQRVTLLPSESRGVPGSPGAPPWVRASDLCSLPSAGVLTSEHTRCTPRRGLPVTREETGPRRPCGSPAHAAGHSTAWACAGPQPTSPPVTVQRGSLQRYRRTTPPQAPRLAATAPVSHLPPTAPYGRPPAPGQMSRSGVWKTGSLQERSHQRGVPGSQGRPRGLPAPHPTFPRLGLGEPHRSRVITRSWGPAGRPAPRGLHVSPPHPPPLAQLRLEPPRNPAGASGLGRPPATHPPHKLPTPGPSSAWSHCRPPLRGQGRGWD